MKKDVKIDYIELLKDSAKFTWKYKILWVFGLILSLFSGGGSSGGSSSNDNDSSNGDIVPKDFSNELSEKIDKIVSNPLFWVVIGVCVIVIILFSILTWYLTSVSKVALFDAVKLDLAHKDSEIKLRKLWKGAHSRILKVFKYDLIWFLIMFPMIVVFVAVIIFAAIFTGPGVIIAVCCCMPLFIIVILILGLIKTIGLRVLLNSDIGIIATIKYASKLIYNNFGKFFFGGIVLFIPLAIIGFIYLIIAFGILAILFVLLFIAISSASSLSLVFIIITIFLIFVAAIFLALLDSPIQVFRETYTTKFVLKLFEK